VGVKKCGVESPAGAGFAGEEVDDEEEEEGDYG